MPARPLPFLISVTLCVGCGHSAIPGDDRQETDMARPSSPMVDAGSAPSPDLAHDPKNGAPSTMYPAFTPDAPQVATAGGPVLHAARFIPVFFAGDDPDTEKQIADFTASLGGTKYWAAATLEYGVGPAKGDPEVVLKEAAPANIDDAAIQTWLAAKLNSNDPAFPAAAIGNIYILHYPAGTTITLPGGRGGSSTSCTDFGGYHGNTGLDANHKKMQVAYAVIPNCGTFGGFSGIEAITATESHELIEAATDPYPNTNPAYAQVDEQDIYWEFILGGGEVGDMCAQFNDSFTKFAEEPFVVQRGWSNDAAVAGHDPCVPAPSPATDPYFNVAPKWPDMIDFGFGGITLPGVLVPIGMKKTIELDLFSDGDTQGPWTISVRDLSFGGGGGASPFNYTLDRNRGQNGEKLHLTIESLRAANRGRGIFQIKSMLGAKSHIWFGVVGQ